VNINISQTNHKLIITQSTGAGKVLQPFPLMGMVAIVVCNVGYISIRENNKKKCVGLQIQNSCGNIL